MCPASARAQRWRKCAGTVTYSLPAAMPASRPSWRTRSRSKVKMRRLTPQWREQQAEAHTLDMAIEENLTLPGFESESERER